MHNHPEVLVKIGPMQGHIDEMLVPLITELWTAWIHAESCCQEIKEGSKYAWIHFFTTEDLSKFLNIVGEPLDWEVENSLYMRMLRQGESAWEYMLAVEDSNADEEDSCSSYNLSAGVLFPQSDIPLLVERLRKYNKT